MSIDKLPPLEDATRKAFVMQAIDKRRLIDPKFANLDDLMLAEIGSLDTYSGVVADYALDRIAALELEREALRAALHGVIDEMAWAEFDPEDDDCWYKDSIKLLSQPPEYWAQKVKEEK